MMMNQRSRGVLIIWVTFFVALVLQSMPRLGGILEFLHPSWLLLTIFYWVLALPNRVNIGTGLILGMILDLMIGSTLGVHGLVMSISVYIVASNYLVIRNLAILQQAFLVAAISALAILIEFTTEFLIREVTFNAKQFFAVVINFILWPWVFYLLRRIRQIWSIR